MARGFKRRGRGRSVAYAASLDVFERHLVSGLLRQVAALLDPDERISRESRSSAGDEFDGIVAGLGDLGRADLPLSDLPVGDVGAEAPDRRERPAYDADDPALQRLLPSGNRADEEAAAEFRRLTEASLRERKVRGLRGSAQLLDNVPEADDAVSLPPDGALTFLVALTDVRLVLASRLGLETDDDAERLHRVAAEAGPDDATAQAAAIYDFLTWLQETLAGCLRP